MTGLGHLTGAESANTPFASTISGYLLPVMVGATLLGIGGLAHLMLRLSRVVGVLARDVIPEGDKSLRERMRELESDVKVIKDRSTRPVQVVGPVSIAPPRPEPPPGC